MNDHPAFAFRSPYIVGAYITASGSHLVVLLVSGPTFKEIVLDLTEEGQEDAKAFIASLRVHKDEPGESTAEAVEIKIRMLRQGLNVAAIARQIAPESDASEQSIRVMLTDMINGRRFFPSLADFVNERYGLGLVRPKHLEPLPSRQAA